MSTKPIDSNLQALAQRGRDELAAIVRGRDAGNGFEVVQARSGEPSLLLHGKALHSRYDPKREASQLVPRLAGEIPHGSPVVLIGLGLGYLAYAWRETRPDDRLFVLEPDETVFRYAVHARAIPELISSTSLHVGSSGLTNLAEELRDLGLVNGRTPAIVEWPGVRDYTSRAAEELRARLLQHTSDADTSPLRILVVGPVYGGTLPMGPHVTRAFTELGHHAELLDFSSFDEGRKLLESVSDAKQDRARRMDELTRLLGRAVVDRAVEMRAQVVFFLAQAPGTTEALLALREQGIVSAMWFVEDARLAGWWQQVAPEYDAFFHIQGDPFTQQLQQAGARHAHYLPLAADPEVHRPLDLTPQERARFGSDLSHVGAGYFNRRRFFLNLLDYDFKLWGSDWDDAPGLQSVLQENGRRVSTDETVRIFNATKINLNLHSSTYTQGVNPHGDFVNPRTFELAACRAFQLVDKRSLLADLFEPGEEVAVFSDLDECRALIDHYLAHPDEADRIAEAARARVFREHTYTHRMDEAVRVIREQTPVQPAKTAGNSIHEMIAAAEDDSELAGFLQSLGEPGDELTLTGIADQIGCRDGELTRPEAFFLLMREFQRMAEEKGLA